MIGVLIPEFCASLRAQYDYERTQRDADMEYEKVGG